MWEERGDGKKIKGRVGEEDLWGSGSGRGIKRRGKVHRFAWGREWKVTE